MVSETSHAYTGAHAEVVHEAADMPSYCIFMCTCTCACAHTHTHTYLVIEGCREAKLESMEEYFQQDRAWLPSFRVVFSELGSSCKVPPSSSSLVFAIKNRYSKLVCICPYNETRWLGIASNALFCHRHGSFEAYA
jgi:hypothetical protein